MEGRLLGFKFVSASVLDAIQQFKLQLKAFYAGLQAGNVIPDPFGRDIIYRFGRTETYPRGAVFGRDLRPLMALEAQVAKYPNASFARTYRSNHG